MNMKWLINLSRVAVLTACAIWLMTRTPGVHAQIMNCYTYNTENGVQLCNSCCTSQPLGDNWTDGTISGAGIQVLSPQNANCGSCTLSCPGGTTCSSCGWTSWIQAVASSECCLPSGYPCNQGTCLLPRSEECKGSGGDAPLRQRRARLWTAAHGASDHGVAEAGGDVAPDDQSRGRPHRG